MSGQWAGDRGATVPFRILATTDLHANLYPYDYLTDRPTDHLGLARTASLIERARAEVRNTLLVDNGDFLQGTPLGEHIARLARKAPTVHPMILAMNVLRYDVGTLGNHDLDFGLDCLAQWLKDARFPIVCGNVTAVPSDDLACQLLARLPPFLVLDRWITLDDGQSRLLKIGVTGVLPPQIQQWNRPQVEGRLICEDMLEATQRNVRLLRQSGANLIIALVHSGIGALSLQPRAEHIATAIAALPEVDVVVAGHSHLVFPHPSFHEVEGVEPRTGLLAGKPGVMPGFGGSHLGVIDLDLTHSDDGWIIQHRRTANWPIFVRQAENKTEPVVHGMATFLEATQAAHLGTRAAVRRPIGKTAVPIHSFFSMITESLTSRLVAEAQAAAVARALRGTSEGRLPLLSAAASPKSGGRSGPCHFTNIPTGELAIRHAADIYPYPNTLCAVRITGRQVADWLEHSAGFFNRLQAGKKEQPLINPDFPSYDFDTLFGLTYEIDLSQPRRFDNEGRCLDPVARRIVNIRLNGVPLDPDQAVVVATNSYRAGGGGSFAALADRSALLLDNGHPIRDYLIRYLRRKSPLSGMKGSSWQFTAMPRTSAYFDTGPEAIHHYQGLNDVLVEPLGNLASGFARFRLNL